jgi:hypothetical protein
MRWICPSCGLEHVPGEHDLGLCSWQHDLAASSFHTPCLSLDFSREQGTATADFAANLLTTFDHKHGGVAAPGAPTPGALDT